MREILVPALDRLVDEGTPGRNELAAHLALVMPGIVIVSWMVMTATNGSLAQGLLVRFGASWRPLPDLAALSFRSGFRCLFAGGRDCHGLGRSDALARRQLIIVLTVPFCLAGLAVLHTDRVPVLAPSRSAR